MKYAGMASIIFLMSILSSCKTRNFNVDSDFASLSTTDFLDYCKEKMSSIETEKANAEELKTLKALFENQSLEFKRDRCDDLFEKVDKAIELDLHGRELIDLRPLAFFKNLQFLDLSFALQHPEPSVFNESHTSRRNGFEQQ